MGNHTSKYQLSFDLHDLNAPELSAGDLNIDQQLRQWINRVIKQYNGSREELAAKMSQYSGATITKSTLDSWTAPSREDWRFPLCYLPVLIYVTKSTWVLQELAGLCGCVMLEGEDVELAQLGQHYLMQKGISADMKRLTAKLKV